MRRGIACPFSSIAGHEGEVDEVQVKKPVRSPSIPRALELAVTGRETVGKPAFPIPKPRELFAMARAIPELGQFLDDIVSIPAGDAVGRAFGIPIRRGGELFANAISAQSTQGTSTQLAIQKATGFQVARPGTREDFVTAITQQGVSQAAQIARAFGIPGIGATMEEFAGVAEEAVATIFGGVPAAVGRRSGKPGTIKPARRITGFKLPRGVAETSKPNLAARFAQPRTGGAGGFHVRASELIGNRFKPPRAP